MEKPVTFQNCGQQLVGMLHTPGTLRREERAPAITMFHGFTGNKSEAHRLFVQIARNLCKSGFIVLRFDFRGSGDSGGEFEDMTVLGEVSDAERSIDFLQDQPNVDKSKIGVIGLSMGGRVAAILASKDRRIRFAVLLSPALGPLRDRFVTHMDNETLNRIKSNVPIKVSNGWYLREAFFTTIDDPVPLNIVNRIGAPVLIIHGDHDTVVPIETSKEGYEIIRNLNERNEFYVVEDGDGLR